MIRYCLWSSGLFKQQNHCKSGALGKYWATPIRSASSYVLPCYSVQHRVNSVLNQNQLWPVSKITKSIIKYLAKKD